MYKSMQNTSIFILSQWFYTFNIPNTYVNGIITKNKTY